MSHYAIGDVQGCYDPLCRLLDQVRFDPSVDRLWFCGDLLNRGPQSLQVARLIRSMGSQAVAVAGNHDLHFLAVALGARKKSKKDTFDELLNAPDLHELVQWVRTLPLLHEELCGGTQWLMVHAGLLPSWTIPECQAVAKELEEVLRGPDAPKFLEEMYGNTPARLASAKTDFERKRALINVLTRMRFCDPDGGLDFTHKGPASDPPRGMSPWFSYPHQRGAAAKVVFGHWAFLGEAPLSRSVNQYGAYPMDTGCVYGGPLSALRLDDLKLFQSPGQT